MHVIVMDIVKGFEYQLIKVHHGEFNNPSNSQQRHKRSASAVHVNAFNNDFTFNLEKSEDILIGSETPIYLADFDKKTNSVSYSKKKIVSISHKYASSPW